MAFYKRLAKRLPKAIRTQLASLSIYRSSRIAVKDFFSTDRKRRVLISYITEPFSGKDFSTHTNRQECRAIAEIFDRMGYSVDIVPYFYSSKIDFSRYACIFGLGDPLCKSFKQNVPGLIRIHYATGAHVAHQNRATLARAVEVHAKRGVWILDSCRVVEKIWSEQTTLVDAMIVLGGDWVAQTYRKHYAGPIYTLSPSYNAELPLESLHGKDFKSACSHYLWFGSGGAIHKGLDLLLEAFAEMPEKTLHIAGPVLTEEDFSREFAQDFALPNIIMHGFVDIASEQFLDLMRQCAFTVLPSCSEAEATSLLNVMCNGLIPVMTRECGFDNKEYAVMIDEVSRTSLDASLRECEKLGYKEILNRSQCCIEDVRTNYSLLNFKKKMEIILDKILSGDHHDAG